MDEFRAKLFLTVSLVLTEILSKIFDLNVEKSQRWNGKI